MKDADRDDLFRGSRHEEVRNVLRAVGPLVAGAGLLLTIVGLGSFFSTFASFGPGGDFGPPRYFWCAFLGLPLVFVGIVLCFAGYGGAVQRYMMGEQVPVARDAFNDLARGTRGGVRDLAEAVGAGLAAGGAGFGGPPSEPCRSCGGAVPDGARFCPGCGAARAGGSCPSCGAGTGPDDRFCPHCGAAQPAGGRV